MTHGFKTVLNISNKVAYFDSILISFFSLQFFEIYNWYQIVGSYVLQNGHRLKFNYIVCEIIVVS